MSSRVVLKIVQGDNEGEEFVFDERTTCVLGRSKGCFPRLVDRKNRRKVSRHHCMLDINPPSVSVRDFGSKNGTFVNGVLIGKREKHQTPDEAARQLPPVHELASGDEIRIQNTIFRVATRAPTVCRDCSVEILDFERELTRVAPGVHLCGKCRERPKGSSKRVPMQMPTVVCTSCGRNVSAGATEPHGGIHICDACKLEPLNLARALIHAAERGVPELSALRGYSVVRQLGGGSMAAVFLAKEHRTGKEVALKLLIPQVTADGRMIRRFTREASNMVGLKHENIVEFYCFGSAHDTFFFVMEYCAGGSLDRYLDTRGGRMPVSDAVKIAIQILDGLDYAHNAEIVSAKGDQDEFVTSRGLVHRNLGLDHIFFHSTGGLHFSKIGDYSLARAFDAAGLSGHSYSKLLIVKPQFHSRRQVLDFRHPKPEDDVWAAAAILYRMIAGHPPRDFEQGKDVWQTVLETSPVPIRQRDGSVPTRLAQVLDIALDDSKELDFKTAAELKTALESALQSESG